MQLIGLDVGFAETAATSGVAALAEGVVRVGRATAAAADRMRLLRGISRATVIAIDAPVLPEMDYALRPCERLLSRGAFQRRCKPGFSHIKGTGLQLRQAGMDTASQLRGLASEELLPARFPRVFGACNIVEAFPNAFLGVCVEASNFESAPTLRRGKKFDWLYDDWCRAGRFARAATTISPALPETFASQCEQNRQHDERAALVCLLTAACVATGRYTAVGEPQGGYLFLPPWSLWSEWAQEQLAIQQARDPSVEVWIDGAVHNGSGLSIKR